MPSYDYRLRRDIPESLGPSVASEIVLRIVTVNFDDVATEEYTSLTVAAADDGSLQGVPVRVRWYEGLVELPAGSVILGTSVRILEAWASADMTVAVASAMARSAGFEHGTTDDWISVTLRSETADILTTEANQETLSPVSGALSGRSCNRAVEIGVRVEQGNDPNPEIPGVPTAGSLELSVVVAIFE